MALPSVPELARLFDDEKLAQEAHAAEALVSWPSLRVLAALCEVDEASTGDIARAVNMDMGEVRDHLEALAELGVVAESDAIWEVTVEQVRLDIELDGELRLSHVVDGEFDTSTSGENISSDSDASGESEPTGFLARVKQWLP